jgi:uncharacterized protein (DUF2384 family)
MLANFLETVSENNLIMPKRMAERLCVRMTSLAKLAHLNRNSFAKPASPIVQERLGEIARIIAKAAELTEDEGKAIIWFRHQPIVGFGMTAEQLVEQGHAKLVLEHLDRMKEGVYS